MKLARTLYIVTEDERWRNRCAIAEPPQARASRVKSRVRLHVHVKMAPGMSFTVLYNRAARQIPKEIPFLTINIRTQSSTEPRDGFDALPIGR